MMWILLAVCSAVLLGVYDVTKKQSLRSNSVLWVLFAVTAISTLLLTPFIKAGNSAQDYLLLIPKAVLVTLCWTSGLMGMKLLPLTTASTIKASRPVFVVLFSVILFAEKLNWIQWTGVAISLSALFLLSHSSKREGIVFTKNKGVAWMGISVLTGVASALWDKKIMFSLDPLFVQFWSNLFITILLGLVVLVKSLIDGPQKRERLRLDWILPLTALLIVMADAFYFFSLKQEGALLSVISLIRRGSTLVTFILAAIIFKEGNLKAKAADMLILLAGIALLVVGSAS